MDKEQAIDLLDNLIGMIEDNQDNDYDAAFRMAIEALRQPEIVQCKDCDWNDGTCYCNFHYRNVKANDHCSWAERRTDGQTKN